MEWLNIYGIIIVVIIMIPNIILAKTNPQAFESPWSSKAIEIIEQIGRFCCMGFIVFNIPFLCFALPLDELLPLYLTVNGVLLVLYLLGWIIFRNKDNLTKAAWLSAVPTAIFLFSGLCVLSVPLVISAIIFGIGQRYFFCHFRDFNAEAHGKWQECRLLPALGSSPQRRLRPARAF